MQNSALVASVTPRKVVVFGGDGFLGSHFVDALAAQGHEITVFGHSRPNGSGNLVHLEGCFRRVVGEFSDEKAVAAALKGQDVAADFILTSTPVSSWEEPLRTTETDLGPTVRFFELCVEQGVRKVLFSSSGGSLYGPHHGPTDENTLTRPFNPHGIVKLCCEHFLSYFRVKSGLASDCYRIGNAYGPRQPLDRTQGVVGAWIGCILAGQPLEVYGDESTLRDYVSALDAAQLMTSSLADLDSTDTYNLGTGHGTSILELLEIFKEVSDRPFEYHVHPRRPLDNPSAILLSGKLLERFPGFTFRDLRQGIRESFDWAKKRM